MARRYAILGTGALGGFYGARLCRAGTEVHFLVHGDFEHVRQHGLVVESKDGDFTLPRVHAYGDVRDMPRCDVVAIALKATNNHLLPDLLPPVLADAGVVLLMARFAADGKPAGVSDTMRAIAQGIPADLSEDLGLARWQKLVWNVPMSGLSVVLDTDTRALGPTRTLVPWQRRSCARWWPVHSPAVTRSARTSHRR
jgi:2-dehydropantoate 2-reductase